eukprot:12841478-Heterocapsa_arctica.AAC.1
MITTLRTAAAKEAAAHKQPKTGGETPPATAVGPPGNAPPPGLTLKGGTGSPPAPGGTNATPGQEAM